MYTISKEAESIAFYRPNDRKPPAFPPPSSVTADKNHKPNEAGRRNPQPIKGKEEMQTNYRLNQSSRNRQNEASSSKLEVGSPGQPQWVRGFVVCCHYQKLRRLSTYQPQLAPLPSRSLFRLITLLKCPSSGCASWSSSKSSSFFRTDRENYLVHGHIMAVRHAGLAHDGSKPGGNTSTYNKWRLTGQLR